MKKIFKTFLKHEEDLKNIKYEIQEIFNENDTKTFNKLIADYEKTLLKLKK